MAEPVVVNVESLAEVVLAALATMDENSRDLFFEEIKERYCWACGAEQGAGCRCFIWQG